MRAHKQRQERNFRKRYRHTLHTHTHTHTHAQVGALYTAFCAMMLAAGVPPILAAMTLAYNVNLFGSITHYASGQAAVYCGSGFMKIPEVRLCVVRHPLSLFSVPPLSSLYPPLSLCYCPQVFTFGGNWRCVARAVWATPLPYRTPLPAHTPLSLSYRPLTLSLLLPTGLHVWRDQRRGVARAVGRTRHAGVEAAGLVVIV
jgi:hypothetical protein